MPKVNHRRKRGTKSYGKKHVISVTIPREDGVCYRLCGDSQKMDEDTVTYEYPKSEIPMKNGYMRLNSEHLDKSMQGWGDFAPLSGRRFGAGIGNDFSNGNRGMAKAVKGAKKFVRTRVRFHENAETRRLARMDHSDED